jgi:hypothetical protein
MDDQEKAALIVSYAGGKEAGQGYPFIPKGLTLEEWLQRTWLKDKKRWRRNHRLWAKFRKHPSWYLTERGKFEATEMALLYWRRKNRINYEDVARRAFPVETMPAGAMPIYAKVSDE